MIYIGIIFILAIIVFSLVRGYKKAGEDIVNMEKAEVVEIGKKINHHLNKIETAKTIDSKVNNCDKIIELLEQAKKLPQCRNVLKKYDKLVDKIPRIKKLLPVEEYLDKAQKHRFKGKDYFEKNALLNALYDIKTKNITNKDFEVLQLRDDKTNELITVQLIENRLHDLGWEGNSELIYEDEYHWRNVPMEDRPPVSFENWTREKQAKYLNVNVINVFLLKKDKLWIYNNEQYRTPEEAVKNYFINEHKYTELPNMFFGYIIHAVIRKLPQEYKWINIDGHKFVEKLYETYQKRAINEANKLSIDGIVNDSLKTDDYFCKKPVDNPVLYWGLIKSKKTLSKWYNAMGIEYIKRYANNIIKGGSPGGWPDLSFIDANRKKIILYEVKTENDRMRRNQYSCYKEISRENCYEYALVFLNRKSNME